MKALWKLFNKTHVWLYRSSDGKRASKMAGKDVILLTTSGRKSGILRTVPVIGFEDGNDRVVVASKAGSPEHPAWFLNLETNPNVTVQVGSDVYRAKAVITSPEERARLWEKVVSEMPQFGSYEKKTSRLIPVVRLVRAA